MGSSSHNLFPLMWSDWPEMQCSRAGSMVRFDRRAVLAGGAAALASAGLPFHDAAADWAAINPDDSGFPDDLGTRVDRFVRAKTNVHGVVIVRRGRMVLERYYEGEDQVRIGGGRPRTERVNFSAERSHELRSVTKS